MGFLARYGPIGICEYGDKAFEEDILRECVATLGICFSAQGFAGHDDSQVAGTFSKEGVPWAASESDGIISLWTRNRAVKTQVKLSLNTADLSIAFLDGATQEDRLPHPIDQLLSATVLCVKRIGLITHSAASLGLCLAGASGAGKSTLSLLIERYAPQATMLTDERSIVFTRGDRLYASGTPWSGTANIARPGEAPLGHVLFLEHADENRLTPMGRTEAATELFRCSFPTFWYRPGMEFALEFCIRVASEIPCMRFGFRPDESAVRFLEREIGL